MYRGLYCALLSVVMRASLLINSVSAILKKKEIFSSCADGAPENFQGFLRYIDHFLDLKETGLQQIMNHHVDLICSRALFELQREKWVHHCLTNSNFDYFFAAPTGEWPGIKLHENSAPDFYFSQTEYTDFWLADRLNLLYTNSSNK